MTIPEVKKVCVIGAGTMGGRISLMSAIRGYETVVYDASKEAIERVPQRHEENVTRWIARGVMTHEDFEKGLPRLTCTTDPEEAAHDADLLNEAVPEIVEVKRKVHAQFEGLCPPHTILSTSTSGLLVSDIEGALKPDNRNGLEFGIRRQTEGCGTYDTEQTAGPAFLQCRPLALWWRAERLPAGR